MIDGVDLALVDTSWLRRQVGVVLQENLLFNRSVRENIALADPAAPMEAVIRAHRRLFGPPPTLRPLVPTSREQAQTWRHTTAAPPDGWFKSDFDDAQWPTGPGGLLGSGSLQSPPCLGTSRSPPARATAGHGAGRSCFTSGTSATFHIGHAQFLSS